MTFAGRSGRSTENEFLVKALDAVTTPLWAFSVIYFHRYQAHKGVDPADRELHRQMLEIFVAETSKEQKQAAVRRILGAFRNTAERLSIAPGRRSHASSPNEIGD